MKHFEPGDDAPKLANDAAILKYIYVCKACINLVVLYFIRFCSSQAAHATNRFLIKSQKEHIMISKAAAVTQKSKNSTRTFMDFGLGFYLQNISSGIL